MLKNDSPTNAVTLRGFARYPVVPLIASMQEVYGLKAACVAVYPMYKRTRFTALVGMDVLDAGATLNDQVETPEARRGTSTTSSSCTTRYTDSTGEDGNFPAKVEMIERLDAELPKIRAAESGRVDRDRRPIRRRAS